MFWAKPQYLINNIIHYDIHYWIIEDYNLKKILKKEKELCLFRVVDHDFIQLQKEKNNENNLKWRSNSKIRKF